LMAEYLRRYGPDCPWVTRDTQWFSVPWNIADANGDGTIDTVETRNAARWILGQTPYRTDNFAAADRFSFKLNVQPGLKDQFTDQFSVSLERELFKDLSVSVTGIYKHAGNLFANIPINRQTGLEWEYDRIPFTTLSGQVVNLYSIKWKDYNGDGLINGTDIQWIGANSDYRVTNMASFDGKKPKRDYAALQLVLNKRYSDRWQALGSFVYSYSNGMANRIYAQSMNVEGPMVTDNNWMSSLNYTINNMEGPLPFTPKYEFKLSGSYTVPYIELDLGARFRMHSGRPVWQLETIPIHSQWGNPPGSVIGAGVGTIVGEDPNKPSHLPTQTILDLRVEKTVKLGRYGTVGIILDVFNVFNANTPTDIGYQFGEFGRVGSILEPRTFRLSFLYTF